MDEFSKPRAAMQSATASTGDAGRDPRLDAGVTAAPAVRRSGQGAVRPKGDPNQAATACNDGDEAAISAAELRDFVAADVLSPPADPAFKLRLKGRLWELVQAISAKQPEARPRQGWQQREIPASIDEEALRPEHSKRR